MLSHPTAADAAAASVAVRGLWTALADDDDAVALQLTATLIHDEVGIGEGFCARLRAALRVTQELAARIGVSSKVRVVEGTMVFVCVEVGPDGARSIGEWGPVRIPLWALWTTVERGIWTVAGTYQQPVDGWPDGTGYLDLPHAPGARSPIQ